jgi:hypothetical protein
MLELVPILTPYLGLASVGGAVTVSTMSAVHNNGKARVIDFMVTLLRLDFLSLINGNGMHLVNRFVKS